MTEGYVSQGLGRGSLLGERKSSAEIVPVILSGGGGSRLWPFSTIDMPKQFLPHLGPDPSVCREALERVRDRSRFGRPVVVASARHAGICQRELVADGEDARLILEPLPRNTAPAVIMAAELVRSEHGDDALLLVMPSDHLIEDVEEFHEAIRKGEAVARDGSLVTFGVRPTSADTGYGYLQMGEDLGGTGAVKRVVRFVEKPNRELAETMVAEEDHLWNAGIFLFRAGSILEEAERAAPEIALAARAAITGSERDGSLVIPDERFLSECPSDSIDYAIMEHSDRVAVVPMSPGWSDLGCWDALATLVGQDMRVGPITALDCESCYIRSDGVQVAALGVRDLIIVASGGRLLILPRGRSQEVKMLLSAMDSIAA